MNDKILCHKLFGARGEEICPSMILSTEGPISWKNLTDSDSRFSRFIKAITSFLCNWSWRPMQQHALVFRKEEVMFAHWWAFFYFVFFWFFSNISRRVMLLFTPISHRLMWVILSGKHLFFFNTKPFKSRYVSRCKLSVIKKYEE
jgi:hypothetical protein